MYAEIIEKLHASNMKLFTYPSKFEVFYELIKKDNLVKSHSASSDGLVKTPIYFVVGLKRPFNN